jgi:hypothetical protein
VNVSADVVGGNARIDYGSEWVYATIASVLVRVVVAEIG